jgi:hypothetical protein
LFTVGKPNNIFSQKRIAFDMFEKFIHGSKN